MIRNRQNKRERNEDQNEGNGLLCSSVGQSVMKIRDVLITAFDIADVNISIHLKGRRVK